MNKKLLIIILVVAVLVLVLAGGGYLLIKSKTPSAGINQIINQGVLPSLGENTNPLKNKPDINPVDATNPFRSIKTNPFQ